MKRRLDVALVEEGRVPSRETAQGLIMAGQVSVDGRVVDKPGARVADEASLSIAGPTRIFVSRGGLKLAGALVSFGLDVAGRVAVDLGASTGGFTDCLLKRGAARVFAVDVGRGQLDWTLRNDARVVVIEGFNARHITPDDLPGLGEGAGIITLDLSFISIRKVLPQVPALSTRPSPADIVALIKPQFEAGKGRVGRGGIVRDPALWQSAMVDVATCAAALGLAVRALSMSVITGAEGNREFFLHAASFGETMSSEEIERHARELAASAGPQ